MMVVVKLFNSNRTDLLGCHFVRVARIVHMLLQFLNGRGWIIRPSRLSSNSRQTVRKPGYHQPDACSLTRWFQRVIDRHRSQVRTINLAVDKVEQNVEVGIDLISDSWGISKKSIWTLNQRHYLNLLTG